MKEMRKTEHNNEEKRSGLRAYFEPAFLICAAVLAIAGGGMSFAIKKFGVYLEKEPCPLKKSLETRASS